MIQPTDTTPHADWRMVWVVQHARDWSVPDQLTLDEEKGPRLIFADRSESIHLADMSGDGLADLVRIRRNDIAYWPNLGFGRFGPKISMDGAPNFDNPDQFDHRRVRVADIDGTGTTDIIHLHRGGVRPYFNQSGNGWAVAQTLAASSRIDDVVVAGSPNRERG